MPVTSDDFRQALSRFASGVTVVTHKDQQGTRRGITVSAFSSVSLTPPLVLICIDLRASIHDHLKTGEFFAVNILAEDQEKLSRHFASKDGDPFEGIGYSDGASGAPLLDAALATLECRITKAIEAGDHTVFLGEVEAISTSDGKPLIYFRGGYARLA